MAANIVSADALKSWFADFVQERLELSDNQVLIQNQQQGQPSFQINDQIAFVNVQFEPDPVNQYKNRSKKNNDDGSVTISQSAMRVVTLGVIFYGPNCDVLAATLLDRMYQDSTKQILSKSNMHFIPDKTQITSPIYENFNCQWWGRSDVKLYFYASTEVSETVGTIQSLNIITKFSNMEV